MIELKVRFAEKLQKLLGEDWENKLVELKAEYDEYAAECACGLRHIEVCIRNYQYSPGMKSKRSYNPIVSFDSRLKTFDSVIEKCIRKKYCGGEKLDIEVIKKEVLDVAGIRIITKYTDDAITLSDALRDHFVERPGTFKDYISNPKENGYKSIQFTIGKDIDLLAEKPKNVPIEIQIRTANMNSWSSIEHDLCYKKDMPGEVFEAFREYSAVLAECDQKAMQLRDLCMKYNIEIDEVNK